MSDRIFPKSLEIEAAKVRNQLKKFIADQFGEAGLSRAIIGISGGIDSAVSASLAAEALGKNNVIGVMMPYRASNPDSIVDAKYVIETIGIRSEYVDISKMVDGYCDEYKVSDPVRKGNIMARNRMIVLYDISAREKGLVVGTSNKTEILVGYGTQHGDIACAINPLGDLYKCQVWQLAEHMGVPERVILKAPSADLWEGQTDEGELGITYPELDELLHEMVDNESTDAYLAKKGFNAEIAERIRDMIKKNNFKRCLPVIAEI